MSTPRTQTPTTAPRERAACMCAMGGACSTFAPGHALHLIQARLASATPTGWTDGLVESIDERAGEIVVRRIADGSLATLWNAAGAADAVSVGLPVAVHTQYSVLAIGRRQFNFAAV